jgi:hypothetical protein
MVLLGLIITIILWAIYNKLNDINNAMKNKDENQTV